MVYLSSLRSMYYFLKMDKKNFDRKIINAKFLFSLQNSGKVNLRNKFKGKSKENENILVFLIRLIFE